MCTVTFIPTTGGIYLTSNRDERSGRAPAVFPCQADADGSQLLFPKDGEAGGSWITLKNSGDVGVLLNGAFVKHHRAMAYRRSRGIVFLEIVRATDPVQAFRAEALEGIEPFTLVLFTRGQLFECRWDGRRKHIVLQGHNVPHIWSSATLYDEEAAKCRQQLFRQWHETASRIDTESILDFHRSVAVSAPGAGLVIDPQGRISTVSITSIRIGAGAGSIHYVDLQTDRRYEAGISVANNKVSRAGFLRRTRIRLTSWEYWPFAVIYAPAFLYWAWLSCKARSFFFFSTANPSITNAGFLMESKQQIYDLMPEGSYPKTVYCPKRRPVIGIRRTLAEQGLDFPLIAKPDIGQRGMQVSLLRDECDLYVYSARSKVDFLLQEYIDYPQEAGIFYYRYPGEPKGRISGIVGKEMLTITGDGVSTVEALLRKNDRHVLQLPALRAVYGDFLQQIPSPGEERLLVPYGNHSRGAKFLDWSDRITPALEERIDELCRQIPGFYFGRLDVKFESWEELCEGRKFSVIELNGAGSEPTHMYDPRHSLFFAWKEIFRHWRLLYDISRANARKKGLAQMSTFEGLKMLRDYNRYEKLIT
ncbi:NRDE family protein [Flavitalea sp. BT771]|uniref:NRDE family protein n=1 Tax=Flavitalea sp. BT771 TaxID=3063329 RepID=UPI0026E1E643|nr:NRDE family protein [Flavitalea sp. BT771]MDO6431141.1 NRDE family protein [Flavitalea sp. BT771]MDV6220048.1 NRDE family protein [Flavitalea sp. BT771]